MSSGGDGGDDGGDDDDGDGDDVQLDDGDDGVDFPSRREFPRRIPARRRALFSLVFSAPQAAVTLREQAGEIDNLTVTLGQSTLIVLCRFHVGAGIPGVAPHYTPPPTTFTCSLTPTGRSKNLLRNRVAGQARLHKDYFHLTNPVFPEKEFRRRYRMSRDLFLVILRGVRNYDPYFQCREPTVEDTRRLLSINECRGFPGMIGSIDCMHWEWKNCPFGWQGAYSGHEEGRTVILEAVISQDLWIWHSFFGMAGSNNDINVLHRSPVFNRLMQGKAPRVSYEMNGNEYDKSYYLADGIYPDWAILVKTVRNPNSEKTRRFAKMQEAWKKDVDRGFGVLQARCAIVRHPARTWSLKTMHEVMACCVIMHNMIVENERPDGRNENHWKFQGELVAPLPRASSWEDYLHMNVEVTNENVCKQLQTDLIEHQWTLAGHEDHA
ncbi:hypothetical protein QYE76_025308 [Lolium multiflorum]|uniref:Uncharacterized protein n=1 Tax=Lolium multiflorum TaxID=4521 RepID=A0AAD8VVW6_LOLMU|nr:hypothetical protein QYE76_025308 [Lolium multiflorum]